MSGTNPGAWPDDWRGDVDDGKRKAFAELDKTIPLYTAAEMKAARLDTVEMVEKLIRDSLDIDYYGSARVVVWAVLSKLKEEINEG